MFKRYFKIIIIVLPILILLFGSIYVAYISWNAYAAHKRFASQLDNTKLLQSLEYSVLNEIVCVATMSQNEALMKKVCSNTKKTTDSVMQQILAQSNDRSLHTLEKTVYTIRNSIENSGDVAVEKLVNGDLDKEMDTFIKNNTTKLRDYNTVESEVEHLVMFTKISDVSYATALEKALVSYYLGLKKAIPSKTLIYWDQTVSRSNLLDIDHSKVPQLGRYINNESFQSLLRQIEDVRIDIMTHASTGMYRYDVATWVGLINKKQKVLVSMESMLLGHIYDAVAAQSKKESIYLLASLILAFVSLLGLWFMLASLRNKSNEMKLLNNVISKVSQYNNEDEKINVPDTPAGKKIAYDYIASSFDKLYDKENKSEIDNKANAIVLNNISYEIRTPMNGISGYTKLLKETPLNLEQSDYVSVIENSFESLDGILGKMLNNTSASEQKLEIENKTFDIVKKVELAIETYTMKADQKDILMGVYIDPDLSHQVKGDGTKLSQILTNLVENALEASSAYGEVNIFVEKVHSSNEQVSVKFSVADQGIGYTAEELAVIQSAFADIEKTEQIPNFDMKSLTISNKIIKRMGGTLELESTKGEGSTFYFTLNFEKDSNVETEVYPTFEGMTVGLALPVRDLDRQIDDNLKHYMKYLGIEMKVYYYDALFAENNIDLPDLMFFYHNYARLDGELKSFSDLPCKTALITSGTLRSRLNSGKYHFSSIVYGPMTMRKVIRILAESKIEQPLIEENITEETQPESEGFENIHALVVEDNEISQKILENVLKGFGVEVTLAEDGQKAFELRREKDFDIIFMDIELPVMNGYEATSKILYYEGVNQLKHVPIVAVSADFKNHDEEKHEHSGMDDYLEKPISADKIHEVIQKYCVELPMQMQQQEEDDFIAKVLSDDFLKVEK